MFVKNITETTQKIRIDWVETEVEAWAVFQTTESKAEELVRNYPSIIGYATIEDVSESGALEDLSDVEITTPKNWEVLSYDATSEKFKNKGVILTEKDLTLYKSTLCAQSNWLVGGVGTERACWRFVPVYKWDNLKFTSTKTVVSPYLQMCFIDKNGDFVYSSTSATVNYTFPQDWYVSFIVEDWNSITLKRGNIFNNLPITDISKESCTITDVVDVDSYIAWWALKSDGTVDSNYSPQWSTYSEVPFKFTDTLVNSINTKPTLSWYSSYVVENGSGTKTAFLPTTIPTSLAFCQNVKVSFCRQAAPDNKTTWQYIYKRTPKKTTPQKVNNSKVVRRAAIGDSITAWNEWNTATSYASVCASLVWDRVKLSKLGYRGHTMKASLATTAFNAIPKGVDIITVNFWSNDIYVWGSASRWDVDTILAKSVSDLQDNQSSFESLRLFFEKCRTKFPRAQIYVITAIKRSTPETAEAFNADELKLCKYYSIPVLDAYNECQIRQSDGLYKADGIHPSEVWKQVFGRWLANKINFL